MYKLKHLFNLGIRSKEILALDSVTSTVKLKSVLFVLKRGGKAAV
jgi:hypothetical protein